MNLPKEVYVFGHKVSIIEQDHDWRIHTDSFGQFLSSVLEIHVCTGVPVSHIKDTLLHEVLHAIWFLSYLPDKAEEEEAVTRISTGLFAVMLDPRNEDLRHYLWL